MCMLWYIIKFKLLVNDTIVNYKDIGRTLYWKGLSIDYQVGTIIWVSIYQKSPRYNSYNSLFKLNF